ncbi:MAG: tRNA uridine-5-carboxymethylaminomethyl(34) synthesis GTPase MnmE [Pseudobdellovibrionaceae bacterium]|nr:tRNA uridine-5-carboxymethylaminomethyl(34) synthesis GTPase MnmE [Pseudobdellovibrionaceae bacterium]
MVMNAEDSNRQASSAPTASPASAGLRFVGEPIAALSTASGASAVAMIRISGTHALPLLEKLLRRRSAAPVTPRMMMMAQFIDPLSQAVVDELMVAVFHGPASFTGEDAAELYCHGGPYIVGRLLHLLYAHGFRPAEPGEFTRRAFLHGKMDLSSAEGIKQLVEAQTEQQWLAARQLATGRFARTIEELRASVIESMAYLAARIDFPDEGDTQDVDLSMVRVRVEKVMQRIQKLEDSYGSGRVAAQGLMVTILGRPNMGKSTLLNTLLGKERAIVTEHAGTTRDYLEEPCRVRGRLIRLVDTAGVREAKDAVEKVGIARGLELAQESDLILLLNAADAEAEDLQETDRLEAQLGAERCLRVLTKADLGVPAWAKGYLMISCQAERGLEQLEEEIVKRVDGFVGKLSEEPFVSSARHLAALQTAKADLIAYFNAEAAGHYDELLAFELQNAARALSSILGTIDVEDVLDKIFRDFCVGK